MNTIFSLAGRLVSLTILLWVSVTVICCNDSDSEEEEKSTDTQDSDIQDSGPAEKSSKTGRFFASTVSGLSFSTPTQSGTTNEDGNFIYSTGETVTFSIGELVLGSAPGQETVTPVDIVAEATDASEQRVNNILVLLQSLDKDGALNTGIELSAEITAIVSEYKDKINFDQATDAFAADPNVVALLAKLNQSQVFTDTDPRDRTLRGAVAAREHFARAVSERKEVETQYGKVNGYAANASTWQWLGVPYAKPPIGDLRWKPTEEPTAWTETRDAIAWSDQAAQDLALEAAGEGGMSEDCLYLNVTAPKDASGLPVMVWFHGGAFTLLTANTKGYNNPDGLTSKDIVLVTVNHRLGPFGYLAHPLLVADSTYGGSGNYGQMDLVMALTWAKNNIANFGGDPNNVTIFGQSGGGGKVVSLMASPMAAGLFHRAVCQSATTALEPDSTNESVIAKAEGVGTDLFTRLGITSVEQARALPWTDIVKSDSDANVSRQVYRPTIDNHYTQTTFYSTLQNGQPGDVPLLAGSTSGDYPTLIQGLKGTIPFRANHSKANLYVYKISKVPANWAKSGVLCGHGGELPYLFNYPEMFADNYDLGLVLDPTTGAKLEVGDLNGNGVTGSNGDKEDIIAAAGWDSDDSAIAEKLMTIWSNFAKSGDPSTTDLTWPAYTAENDTYVEIGPTTAMEVKTGLDSAF